MNPLHGRKMKIQVGACPKNHFVEDFVEHLVEKFVKYDKVSDFPSCTLSIWLTAVILGAVLPPVWAVESKEKTKELIEVLQSEASLFEKARACQQLGEVGTLEAVPALAELLSDPKLSAYARSGLEGIPGPSAAAALRDAAEKLKGPLLAGVVNSLGVLRDAQATDLLGRLATDPSSGVAPQALLALGNISTPTSIRLLKNAL